VTYTRLGEEDAREGNKQKKLVELSTSTGKRRRKPGCDVTGEGSETCRSLVIELSVVSWCV